MALIAVQALLEGLSLEEEVVFEGGGPQVTPETRVACCVPVFVDECCLCECAPVKESDDATDDFQG